MVRRNDAAFRLIADRTLVTTYESDDIVKIWQRWFSKWAPEPPLLLKLMYSMESLAP